VRVTQHAPAHSQHQGPMPPYQFGKRLFLVFMQEKLQEVHVFQAVHLMRLHHAAELSHKHGANV